MLNHQKILRDLNKIQKLWIDKGVDTVFKKAIHLTAKKITRPADKRTLIRRDFLLNNNNLEALWEDITQVFSSGFLRPLNKIKSNIRLIPPEVAKLILKEAEGLLNHEFTIYGNLNVSYKPNTFSWSHDPLTGFVWPQTVLYNRGRVQKKRGTDIKTIWEIARFQFLSSLAYAFTLTGEKRYAQFAIDKVNSWVDENLFQHGPHWCIPMESSIRLINWCVYLPLLNIFKYTSLTFKRKLTQSILEHLVYVRENLEVSPSLTSNHYLADLVGLLTAKQLFPSLEWAVECTEFAKKEFDKEVQTQFKESGINFEGSLPYHRLSTEICLMGWALLKINGQGVSVGVNERLRKTADFTKYYTSMGDRFPIIGDNDSGIYLKYFPGQEENHHGYLNCLFDAILDNKSHPKNFDDYLCAMHFSHTSVPDNSGSDISDKSDHHHLQVRDFDGLIIARRGSDALFFNSLQSSQGHTHNDKLTIYPVIDEKLLFLDRGSFSYSGFLDKRQQDRMSASHNSPTVNDWEQNTIWRNDLFYNNGEAKCFSTIEHSDSILKITGWHVGYERFGKDIKIFRQIKWDTTNRTLLISDWLEGEVQNTKFQFKWYFLINPLWTTNRTEGGFIFADNSRKVRFEDVDGVDFNVIQGFYCPSYQVEKRCEALAGSINCIAGKRISFLLRY